MKAFQFIECAARGAFTCDTSTDLTVFGAFAVCMFMAAGCEGWPGEPGEYVPSNTYQIACACRGRITDGVGSYETIRYEMSNICQTEVPNPWQRELACGAISNNISGTYGAALAVYTCGALPGATPVLIGENNCATIPGSSTHKALDSGGIASGRDMSIAWPNSMADEVGELVDASVQLQLKFARWRGARPVPHGKIFLTGGQCPLGQSCEVVLDGLDLTVDDFSINRPWPARDIDFRQVTITNVHRWVGVKRSDDSVEFPEARLKLAGRIEGQNRVLVVDAAQPIRGRFVAAADGSRRFTIDGNLAQERMKLDLSLSFQTVRHSHSNGELCILGSHCASGFCADGVCCNTACDAGPCDACSVAAGAAVSGVCATITGAVCDDGNACTQSDTCEAGLCVGASPIVCAASDQCHVDGTCDPATGICEDPAKPDGASCTGGVCQAGTCMAETGGASSSGTSAASIGDAGGASMGSSSAASGESSADTAGSGGASSDGDASSNAGGGSCQMSGGAPPPAASLLYAIPLLLLRRRGARRISRHRDRRDHRIVMGKISAS